MTKTAITQRLRRVKRNISLLKAKIMTKQGDEKDFENYDSLLETKLILEKRLREKENEKRT